MKKALIAVSAIAVLAGIGFGGMMVFERQVAGAVAAELQRNGATVETVRYSLLRDQIDLTGITFQSKDTPATKVTVERMLGSKINRTLLADYKAAGRKDGLIPVAQKLESWGVAAQQAEQTFRYAYGSTEALAVNPAHLPEGIALEEVLLRTYTGTPEQYAAVAKGVAMEAAAIDRIEVALGKDQFSMGRFEIDRIAQGVAGTVTVRDMKGTVNPDKKTNFTLASVSAKGLDLASLEKTLSLTDLSLAKLEMAGPEGEKIAMDSLQLAQPGKLTYGEVESSDGKALLNWSFAKFALTGLAVNVPQENVSVTFDNFSIDGYGEQKIKAIRLAKLGVEVPKDGVKFGLDAFEADEIDFVEIVKTGNPQGAHARKGRVAGMVLDMADKGQILLSELTSETSRVEQGLPTAGMAKITGFALDKIADPEVKAALGSFGYERLSFDLDMAYDWKLASGEFTLGKFRLSGKDAGALDLSMVLQGLDRETATSANPFLLMQGVMLDKFSLTYEDASLVDRAFKAAAAEQGGDAEMMRVMALTVIDQQAMEMDDSPVAVEALKAVRAFVEKPKNLSLTLSPSEPVGYMDLMDDEDPAAMARLLGLKIQANR